MLAVLDEIEGYRPNEPERSLYTRVLADVTLEDGRVEKAWTYFYNAPLGRAQRIASGDYLEHLNVRLAVLLTCRPFLSLGELVDEVLDGGGDALGGLDELDARCDR